MALAWYNEDLHVSPFQYLRERERTASGMILVWSKSILLSTSEGISRARAEGIGNKWQNIEKQEVICAARSLDHIVLYPRSNDWPSLRFTFGPSMTWWSLNVPKMLGKVSRLTRKITELTFHSLKPNYHATFSPRNQLPIFYYDLVLWCRCAIECWGSPCHSIS
jgi:hypothetical protein